MFFFHYKYNLIEISADYIVITTLFLLHYVTEHLTLFLLLLTSPNNINNINNPTLPYHHHQHPFFHSHIFPLIFPTMLTLWPVERRGGREKIQTYQLIISNPTYYVTNYQLIKPNHILNPVTLVTATFKPKNSRTKMFLTQHGLNFTLTTPFFTLSTNHSPGK